MQDTEKRGFLFRYRWSSLFEHLSAGQVALVIKAMTAFSKGQNVKKIVDKMAEKTQMAWEWIADDMLQDIKSYEARCAKNRENAKLGGQAKAKNSERYQSLPNATERNQSLPIATEWVPKKANGSERVAKIANGSETCPIDKERDKDRDKDCDKDTERDKRAISLSHKIFCENFPDRATACTTEKLPEYFDIDKLLDSMKKSSFLSSCKNLDFGWCVNNYDEIISGKYKNYNANKQVTEDSTKIKKREYSDSEKSDIFDNFDKLDLEE